jgi:hypothetical protein
MQQHPNKLLVILFSNFFRLLLDCIFSYHETFFCTKEALAQDRTINNFVLPNTD